MYKLLTIIFLSFSISAAASAETCSLTNREVEKDLVVWLEWTLNTHPDLSWSSDLDAVESQVETLKEALPDTLCVRDVWRHLGALNPTLNDAHTGLRYPEAAWQAWIDNGGAAFPLDIRVDGASSLKLVDGFEGLRPNAKVVSINGISAEQILSDLLPLLRGEGDALREFILETRFPQLLWSFYGDAKTWTLEAQNIGEETQSVLVTTSTMGRSGAKEPSFEFEMLDNDTAVLTIKTFDIGLKTEAATFFEESFKKLREAGAKALIIDIRQNGGGAHDVSDLVMPYLTDQKYSATSAVKARITEQNMALVPGSSPGQVLDLPWRQWITPGEEPLRFSGDTYILLGKRTYSQAIVFAVTAQDFNIAKIAGEETTGPANQTGQVQFFSLPNSGLRAMAPLYIFFRPSGDRLPTSVRPDIGIIDVADNPDLSLEAVAAWHRNFAAN